MKRIISFSLLAVLSTCMISCGNNIKQTMDNTESPNTEAILKESSESSFKETIAETESLVLNDIIVGRWTIAEGGVDEGIPRIFVFYESGMVDTYIGSTKDAPAIGCYEIDDNNLYFNSLKQSNPRDGVCYDVVSFNELEIVLSYLDKTIVWKKYE